MEAFEKFSLWDDSVIPVYHNDVRAINKHNQCIYGDSCRAYMKKFGNIFNVHVDCNTCPHDCEFYKPKE